MVEVPSSEDSEEGFTPSLDQLCARVARAAARGRVLVGITGPPGAGKSTLAGLLVRALGELAVLVPMDGFHLAGAELERLGRAERKGAVDTFDAAGYAALLARLRRNAEPVVYAPEFSRALEEPIAGAIAVPAAVRIVITEGNYLLDHDSPFCAVRPLLDEIWYLELDDELRRERLVARHRSFGRDEPTARSWVQRVDEANAERIRAARSAADLVVVGA